MPKFKIVTTGPGNTDHSLEMESLGALGAVIFTISWLRFRKVFG